MTDAQQREVARRFYHMWYGKGKEDEDATVLAERQVRSNEERAAC